MLEIFNYMYCHGLDHDSRDTAFDMVWTVTVCQAVGASSGYQMPDSRGQKSESKPNDSYRQYFKEL